MVSNKEGIKMIEHNRRVYGIEKHWSNRLLVIEDEPGVWAVLAKGWSSDLWDVIGRRAALAENGKLTVSGRVKPTIESYIEMYESLIAEPEHISKLFQDFLVEIEIDLNDSNLSRYTIERLEKAVEDYSIPEISPRVYKGQVHDSRLFENINLEHIKVKPVKELERQLFKRQISQKQLF